MGGMHYSKEEGIFIKFNTKDRMKIELLKENNLIPVIITIENSENV